MSDTDAPRTSADDVHGGPEARPSGDGPIRFAAVIPRDAPVGEWPVRLHFRSQEDLARLLNRNGEQQPLRPKKMRTRREYVDSNTLDPSVPISDDTFIDQRCPRVRSAPPS